MYATKQCILDITWPLYPWMQRICHYLMKTCTRIYLSPAPHVWRKNSWGINMQSETMLLISIKGQGSQFFADCLNCVVTNVSRLQQITSLPHVQTNHHKPMGWGLSKVEGSFWKIEFQWKRWGKSKNNGWNYAKFSICLSGIVK